MNHFHHVNYVDVRGWILVALLYRSTAVPRFFSVLEQCRILSSVFYGPVAILVAKITVTSAFNDGNNNIPPPKVTDMVNMGHFLDLESVLMLDTTLGKLFLVNLAQVTSSSPSIAWLVVGLGSYGSHFLPMATLESLYFPLETQKVPFS